MKKNTHIQELIQKYLHNECTHKEVEEIISFFQHKENLENFPEVEEVLENLTDKPEIDDLAGDRVFSNILSIANEKEFHSKKLQLKKFGFWKYAVAAMFIGIIGITYFFNQPLNSSFNQLEVQQDFITLQLEDGSVEVLAEGEKTRISDEMGNLLWAKTGNQLVYHPAEEVNEIKYNTIRVPYGKKFQIQLSDGTNVHLNSGTSLKYPVQFKKGENRKIFLTGEAFFDVTKDKDHPFIVSAEHLNVQVLGTRFNVSSYEEDAHSDVVLVEGSVEMFPGGVDIKSDSGLLLKPGFKGSFDKQSGSMTKKKVMTGVYTSWINGELVFRNMTFGNIMKKLERHYNLTIENKNKVLEKETFNANFGNEPIEKVLEYLKTMYGISYSIHKNKVVIE